MSEERVVLDLDQRVVKKAERQSEISQRKLALEQQWAEAEAARQAQKKKVKGEE